MEIKEIYIKLEKVIDYIDKELDKPVSTHSYETRLWGSGYIKAMQLVKKFIVKVFIEDLK